MQREHFPRVSTAAPTNALQGPSFSSEISFYGKCLCRNASPPVSNTPGGPTTASQGPQSFSFLCFSVDCFSVEAAPTELRRDPTRPVIVPASAPRTSSHQPPVQHVSLSSGAASGRVLRPCRPATTLTTWTLGEELLFLPKGAGCDSRLRARGPEPTALGAGPRGSSLSPPVTKITTLCPLLRFCSCLGSGTVPAAWLVWNRSYSRCTQAAWPSCCHMALKVLI